MSVPEQLPIVSYIANGATTSFAITFDLHDDKYLLVTKNKELMPVGSYSIQDRSVIFGTAPVSGDEITLARDTQLDRETNFKSYDNSFRPESINWDLDKLWHVLQEQNLVDAKILARIKEEIEWRRTHDENIVLNIDNETDQRRIIDDRIREEISQEVQARRTLDLNYDTLAQVRDLQVFGALKQYLDTILASATPNIFGGVTAGVVFALDKKSIQTHLEEILNKLEQDRIDIGLNAKKSYVDEMLDRKANSDDVFDKTQTYSSTEVDKKILPKADKVYVDNALIGFTNGAAKFYPTLVEANLDIRNIQPTLAGSLVRDKIEIGEIENGGTWYKENYDSLSLKKSQYDQFQQGKIYTDTSIGASLAYEENFFNLNHLISINPDDAENISYSYRVDEKSNPYLEVTSNSSTATKYILYTRTLEQKTLTVSAYVKSKSIENIENLVLHFRDEA